MKSPKIHSNKSTWPIFGSIRDWFTRSSKEKSTSSNRLIYPPEAVRESIGELILARQILPPYFGYTLTLTKTGSCSMNITKRGKQLIIMPELSIVSLHGLLQLLTVIQAERNGLASLHKGVSISPLLIKKREPTKKTGLDMELRKSARSSSESRVMLCQTHLNNPTLMYRAHQGGCHLCSYLTTAQISLGNLKPTVGKKKASRGRKI